MSSFLFLHPGSPLSPFHKRNSNHTPDPDDDLIVMCIVAAVVGAVVAIAISW